MSRRNTRQGKARRRAERDRRQVLERERKRPRTSDQGFRAVEDQAVQAAPRPEGYGPRNSDERGSGLRSDAGGGLIAVNLDGADLDTDADLNNADLDDFGDLGADGADLQAALADGDLEEADISDVAEVAGDLVGDLDGPEVPDGPEDTGDSAADQPSAEADPEAEGPGAAGARVVKISPDGAGEDEEIFVFGDDDDDLPAAQVAVAGASADPVKDYLRQIGKVPLLNAEQEVELAKRIEAGLFRRGEAGRAPLEPVHRRADRPGVDRRGRATPQGPPAGGEPAPGGLAGQAVHRAGHAVPGPDPGGQPGADPGGGEVRLHQGLPDGPNPGQAPANRAVGRRLAPRRRQRVVDYLLDV